MTRAGRYRARQVCAYLARQPGVEVQSARPTSNRVLAADIVLPLSEEDRLFLLLHAPGWNGRKYLLPWIDTLRLLADKQALSQRLVAEGFGAHVPLPRAGSDLIRKPRIGDSGNDVSRLPWREVPEDDPAWTWQRAIDGAEEYAAHLMVGEAGVLSHFGVRYVRKGTVARSGISNLQGRSFELPADHAVLFGQMLGAVGYRGFACVNYFVEDGRPQVIEINARLGSSALHAPEWVGHACCLALLPEVAAGMALPRIPATVPDRGPIRLRLRALERQLRTRLRHA